MLNFEIALSEGAKTSISLQLCADPPRTSSHLSLWQTWNTCFLPGPGRLLWGMDGHAYVQLSHPTLPGHPMNLKSLFKIFQHSWQRRDISSENAPHLCYRAVFLWSLQSHVHHGTGGDSSQWKTSHCTWRFHNSPWSAAKWGQLMCNTRTCPCFLWHVEGNKGSSTEWSHRLIKSQMWEKL